MSRTIPASARTSARADIDRSTALLPQILKRIVHFLTSMRVALLLLLILALLTLAGTLLAQAPPDVKGDPQSYEAWLDSLRPRYGGWTQVLDTLGLFSVFSTIWFKATALLLSASILTCATRRAPGLWRQATRPPTIIKEALFDRAPFRARVASQLNRDDALATLRDVFRAYRFRTVVQSDGDAIHVCADRFRWGPFGRLVAHVSIVLILIAALIGATSGFRNDQFAVTVGTKANVGFGTDMAVKVNAFTDTWYPNGQPRDFASELILYKGGTPVRRQTIRVNHPMKYDGVKFYQSFFGGSAVMRVKTLDGHTLFNRGVPLLWESKNGKDRIGRFSLPEQGLTVFVVGPASGKVDPRIAAGQMQLEVYRSDSDTPVALRVVSEGRSAKLAGLDFTFAREREFTGLIVARAPGTGLVWIGSSLLVIGICTVFFFPHRRVRAVVRDTANSSEIKIAATAGGRDDTLFESEFQDLVDDMALAVSPGASEKGV